jgi:bifunctional UDP-N-acetylglucosamine 2-epimerase / N-acetylmannosamine kinase
MNKRKICVVITARPSYSRIKTALTAIKDHPNLELQIVLAGSSLLERYGDASKIIEKDGFNVTEKIYNVIEGDSVTSMAKTTGVAIMELSTVFYNLNPDMVITIADRFETIATSIAASYQNIPLVHIQGGEVTGNIDEKVRHANTKLADIHLVANDDARQRVIKMGEEEKTVVNTGCPSMDLAREVLNSPTLDFDPIVKYGGVGNDINWKDGYIVVMQHPVTTEFEASKRQIKETLKAIDELNIPTFWFWPNVDAGSDGTSSGIRQYRENNKIENIHFFKNMSPNDFLRLIKNSKCLVGNSSVGIRESAFLGVPVVNIGSRQNRRQRASSVIDCGYLKDEIKRSVRLQFKVGSYCSEFTYGDGYAGQKIADALVNCDLTFHKTITY